jgi:hypothetical protein
MPLCEALTDTAIIDYFHRRADCGRFILMEERPQLVLRESIPIPRFGRISAV